MNVLVQILGIVAFAFLAISIQSKKKSSLLFFQILASIIFIIQFLLLGAYAGVVIMMVSVFRSVIFYKYKKENKKIKKNILFIFTIIILLSVVVTYNEITDIMPAIALLISTYLLSQNNLKWVRIGEINVCIMWIIYNAAVGAYINIFTQIIILMAAVFGILKHDINKSKKENIVDIKG